jgi:hypothetical protein
MKTKNIKALALCCAFFALLFFGCQKDYQRPIEPQKFSSKEEAKTYLNQKLSQYGEVLAKLAQNPKIRKFINQKVAQKFDGDYNVLLKDLVSRQVLKLDQIRTMSEEPGEPVDPGEPSEPVEPADMEALADLLIEPLVIGTDTLYPQIYIPFYAEHMGLEEQEDPCPSSEGSPAVDYPYPVILTHDGEEIPGQDTFTGYSFDSSGARIDGIVVDECFAQKHVVWAVTINERVNNSRVMVAPPGYDNNPPPAMGPTPVQRPDLYITNMTVKDHKESWIKGASDICMYVGVSWDNGINPNSGLQETSFWTKPGLKSLPDQNDEVNNIEIRKFSRKEVRQKRSIDVNFTYFRLSTDIYGKFDPCLYLAFRSNYSVQQNTSDYNECKTQNPTVDIYFYPEKGDYLYYTVYESDAGITGLNGYSYVQIPGNNYIQKIYYRSNEEPYMSGRLKIQPKNQPTQAYDNTGWANINNSAISFTLRNR